MHTPTLMALASALGASLAMPWAAAPAHAAPQQPHAPRQTQDSGLLSNLFKLADAFGINACIPYGLPLVSELPTLPKGLVGNDLVTQALSQTTLPLSGVCDFSVTGTVGDKFTAFLPEWYEWYSAHSTKIQSIISHCPKASALVSTVEAFESCDQVKSVTATWTGGSGSGSASASDTASSASGATTDLSIETSTGTESDGATASSQTGADDGAQTTLSNTSPGAPTGTSVSQGGAAGPRETGAAVLVAAAAAAGFMGAVAVL